MMTLFFVLCAFVGHLLGFLFIKAIEALAELHDRKQDQRARNLCGCVTCSK